MPRKPGVYLFRDDAGTVIYVGKAANLNNRVRSYFATQPIIPKLRKMIPRISDIDFFITDSEHEALVLESNLIKKHRPIYNVRLKDDKSYPYLKITLFEEWPRVFVTRRPKNDDSKYFGPYASPGSTRQTLNWINKIFPYRTCKKTITGTDPRPCLKYHINRCSGPCIGAISQEEYRDVIGQVVLFLGGKQEKVIRALKKKMAQTSTELKFEKAALLRDQIQSLERLVDDQKVISTRKINEDAIAIAQAKNMACAQVFFIRNGKLLGKEHFRLEGTQDEDSSKIITSFIEQFYNAKTDIPARILIQTEPEDKSLIEEWLGNRQGHKVRLIIPKRGEKKQLMEMVSKNAAEMLEQLQLKWLADSGKTGAAMEELKTSLNLPRIPKRIECYDISNLSGTAAVGSMVVFEDGRPKSAHYRRFKIKTVSGIDDYAMMQEVLRRRFAHGIRSTGESWGYVPDLILIDGGRGHLNIISQLMQELEIESISLAGIAKENEDIFVSGIQYPIVLPRNSQALFLLQRVRDEAHRFAISYHTNVRKKTAFKSRLDHVPGIGPTLKKALLKEFGTLKAIEAASIEELVNVQGITKPLAEKLKEYL